MLSIILYIFVRMWKYILCRNIQGFFSFGRPDCVARITKDLNRGEVVRSKRKSTLEEHRGYFTIG